MYTHAVLTCMQFKETKINVGWHVPLNTPKQLRLHAGIVGLIIASLDNSVVTQSTMVHTSKGQ